MYRKSIATITVLCFFVSSVFVPLTLLADTPSTQPGQIMSIEKGGVAPFAGTLFSTSAAAKLLLDLQYNQESCKIEINKEKGLLSSKFQLDIDKLNSTLSIERELFQKRLAIKNSQVKFFMDRYEPIPWYNSGEFWFAMGLVGGVLITVASGYALGQAAD